MPENTLPLSQLAQHVKTVLANNLGDLYWIEAEIAELKVNAMSGHCYLELIEKDGQNKTIARLRATIWGAQFRMIKPYFESSTGQFFESGIKVLIRVTVEFHEVYGMSLNVRDIDPSFTMGDLNRKRMEILAQLEEDGVLDMNKDLEYPRLCQRIAVISSENAAGCEDFLEQLNSNQQHYHFETRLYPAVMQGEGAALSIMNALDEIYQDVDNFDCVVIVRGGGATLDLTCFDDYDLAYLITQFPLPVLSGIGHQKDDTITDLVAFQKLKTPTAVAEYLISMMSQEEMQLDSLVENLIRRVEEQVDNERQRFTSALSKLPLLVQELLNRHKLQLHHYNEKLPYVSHDLIKSKGHHLEVLSTRLRDVLSRGVVERQSRLDTLKTTILRDAGVQLEKQAHRLKELTVKTELLDPRHLLERGYSIVSKNGRIIKNANEVRQGDMIHTQLFSGSLESEVKKKMK